MYFEQMNCYYHVEKKFLVFSWLHCSFILNLLLPEAKPKAISGHFCRYRGNTVNWLVQYIKDIVDLVFIACISNKSDL